MIGASGKLREFLPSEGMNRVSAKITEGAWPIQRAFKPIFARCLWNETFVR